MQVVIANALPSSPAMRAAAVLSIPASRRRLARVALAAYRAKDDQAGNEAAMVRNELARMLGDLLLAIQGVKVEQVQP